MPVIGGVSMRSRYLFKRRGSDNWYVRLQPPGQKLVERSLGTTDLKAAEIAAADVIKRHKAFMYQRRQARVASVVHGPWTHEYAPGLHTLPDGRTVMATATDLTFSDGTRRRNGGPAIYLVGEQLPATREFRVFDDADAGHIGEGPIPAERPKFVAAKSSDDDKLLETYITHAALSETREAQAREMWRIFRTVVNKPLAKCTRDDGRKIVAHLEAEKPLKSTTLKRYMVPLIAIVNLAIDEGKHTGINPFANCVPDREDEEERKPFNDDDMKVIRANLHKLGKSDQLLVRLLATTGMRRGEAFSIASEKTKDGVRYCTVGTKTDDSRRQVPFPKELLPHLPAKIAGQLIPGRMDSAGKRLKKWLIEIGITDPDKAPMHSFRHRAKNRMRQITPDEELRNAIGGWSSGKKNSGWEYGREDGDRGFPIKILKKTIDKIGM